MRKSNSLMVDVTFRVLLLKKQIAGRPSTYASGMLDGLKWVHGLIKKHYRDKHSLGLPEEIFKEGFDYGQSLEFKEGSYKIERKACFKQFVDEKLVK